MNILMLSTHVNAGGITSYLLTLSKELVSAGHHVTVASGGGNMSEEFKKLGVRCLILSIRTKSELSPKVYLSALALRKFIKGNSVDIIHAQTRVTQVTGKLASLSTRATYVSTCHGFFKPRLSRKVFGCWGDSVIAISPQVKQHLINDLCVPEKKCIVIQNGIDVEKFSPADPEYVSKKRNEFGFNGKDKVVGIVARLSDVKGHAVLIDAFREVVKHNRNVKLMIVGIGKEEEKLKEQVKQLKLQDTVVFEPSTGNPERFLKIFDLFVMPSLQEGLGISIMEAQAAGLAVVASRVGGIPALINDGETGLLVEPKNSEELAERILQLLDNQQEASRIGANARKFIQKDCSSSVMCSRTVACYKKAMENK